jgi:amino acid adenylation domain-containing protein
MEQRISMVGGGTAGPGGDPAAAIEEWLVRRAAQALGVSAAAVDPRRSPGELGLDSLRAAELAAAIETDLALPVTLPEVLAATSFGALATKLAGRSRSGAQPVPPAPVEPLASLAPLAPLALGTAPTSFAERRIWFAHQVAADPTVHHLAVAFRLCGPLAADALRRAVEEIVRRHESLRGAFALTAAGLVRRPAATRPRLVERPLSGDLATAIQGIVREPFDLGRGPLLRAVLLKLGEDDHALVLAAHHIACDGASLPLFLSELERFYREPPRVGLPFQYGEYARAQRRFERPDDLAPRLDLWAAELAGAPARLALWASADGAPGAPGDHVGSFRSGVATVARLRELGGASGATTFMIVLAALHALLHHEGGGSDQGVGIAVQDRALPGAETAIGAFLNFLPVRAQLHPGTTFRQLLAAVRDACLRAFAYREVPCELLIERLRPGRAAGEPFFQAVLSYRVPPEPPCLAGIAAEEIPLASESSEYELSVFVEERGGALAGRFVLGGAPAVDARDLARRFALLLQAIAADPDTRVGELLLPAAAGWTAAAIVPVPEVAEVAGMAPAATALHRLIAAQTAATPDRPAVVAPEGVVSYGELDRRSRRLAAALDRAGAGRGDVVALLMERTAAMVAAVLAILDRGGAYLPLDPSHPLERLRSIATDSGARLLVTDPTAHARRPLAGMSIVLGDGGACDGDARALLPVAVDPLDLAYVIYTSGSTGAPKGAMIPHGAVANLLASASWLGAGDRVAAATTLAFDFAVTELLFPLARGATVHLCDAGTAIDGRLFAAFIERCRASVVQGTPATWRMLLDAGWQPRPGMRLLCGGEALAADLAHRLVDGGAELWNLYGPTETTVFATLQPVRWSTLGDGRMVPIGRPVAGASCLVLNPLLALVPPGAVGELGVAGAGLGRGYLGRPDATAERFVPHPGASRPGERLYRTGDLVRQDAAGDLRFLGRIDRQLKLRGFRIEAGEVEAVLAGHPAVERCAVDLKVLPAGEPGLTAYLVRRAEEPRPTAGELRAHARRRLPEPMVPGAWIWLDAIPETPSRKVDYAALPTPGAAMGTAGAPGERSQPLEPPANEIEARVLGLWQGLVGVEGLGVEDDFFEGGGNSLLVGRLLAQINAELGVELPVRVVFERPTVRTVAVAVARARGAALTPILAATRADRESPAGITEIAEIDEIDAMSEAELDSYLRVLSE